MCHLPRSSWRCTTEHKNSKEHRLKNTVVEDRMVDANEVLDMIKYATRSRSKYVSGREEWKSMVVNKLMYGCDH